MTEFGPAFDRAQARYDAMEPEEDHEDECTRCDGKGWYAKQIGEGCGQEQEQCELCLGTGKLCVHKWHRIPGESKDGTRFAKCRKCGKVVEV